MSLNLRFAPLARAVALSAALALPAATAAFADGDFNTNREDINLQSAATASPFSSVKSAARAQEDSRLATTSKTVPGKRDLLGAGGHQDELANQIYQPGHTVGF
jgi:hypothetical protein